MIRDYSDPAVWWEEYESAYAGRSWRDYRHLLAEVIRYGSGGPVLDVGCGYGFLVECARRFGIAAVGLECAPLALAAGRARHPLADIRSWHAGTSLPLESDSIGVAVLNEFVDHVTLDQNRALFAELHRALKPAAVLIVKSPSRFNTADQDKGHVTFFSPSEFRRFVEDGGLEVVSQPYQPRALLGTRRLPWLAMRALTALWPREAWASRIDLVARKPFDGPGEPA